MQETVIKEVGVPHSGGKEVQRQRVCFCVHTVKFNGTRFLMSEIKITILVKYNVQTPIFVLNHDDIDLKCVKVILLPEQCS